MLKKVSELEVDEIFKNEGYIFKMCKRETHRSIWTKLVESSDEEMKVGHTFLLIFDNGEEMVEVING